MEINIRAKQRKHFREMKIEIFRRFWSAYQKEKHFLLIVIMGQVLCRKKRRPKLETGAEADCI